MSLESAIEEERLEILKLLERSNPSSPPLQPNPSSPLGSRTTSPNRGRVTSLIDTVSPQPGGLALQASPNSSPNLKFSAPAANGLRNSATSAAPRLLRDRDRPASNTAHDEYQFSILPSAAQAVPKRVIQTSKPIRSMLGGGADDRFVDMKGKLGKRTSSPTSNAAMRHAQARSASPITGWQPDSARSSSGRLSSPPPGSNRFSIATEDPPNLDMQHAYRRLNDEALASSGGVLGLLPEKKAIISADGGHIRADPGESITTEGGVRLQKDYKYKPGEETAAADSSDEESTEDGDSTSGEGKSDDEDGRRRGRRKQRANGASDSEEDIVEKIASTMPGSGRKISSLLSIGSSSRKKGEKKKPMSLLAAVDEERKVVSSRYKVHSLLPSISVTQPGSASSNVPSSPIASKRSEVHPTTNFDISSTLSTPISSETELDLQDIRRAQRMEIIVSQITSTPETHRVVRTIVRGDFDALQDEAEQGKRRQRTYLVATDMSGEAAHALEWTIGTVLRDGDTLLAMYAADEDSVDSSSITPTSTTAAAINGLTSAEGGENLGTATSPATAIGSPVLASIPNFAQSAPSSPLISFSTPPSRSSSPPPSIGMASRRGSGDRKRAISRERGNNTEKSKAELERVVAAENITQLITKLLKKTRLQVRCVVEVIHCKSPKHLLTEMIDYIEPTLVILGSRGRSALKGVLLGSFSNYLVTKSSVPVMVARKKLKQHSSKKKRSSVFAVGTGDSVNVRLTNNLVPGPKGRPGGSLALAKVD